MIFQYCADFEENALTLCAHNHCIPHSARIYTEAAMASVEED